MFSPARFCIGIVFATCQARACTQGRLQRTRFKHRTEMGTGTGTGRRGEGERGNDLATCMTAPIQFSTEEEGKPQCSMQAVTQAKHIV